MKNTYKALALCLLISIPLSLSARKHVINDENVQCTLRTYTLREMLDFIGNEGLNLPKGTNEFLDASEQHLAIEVTIKNGNKPIKLPAGEYLMGLEDYLSLRSTVASPYSAPIALAKEQKTVLGVLAGIAGLLPLGAMVAFIRDGDLTRKPLASTVTTALLSIPTLGSLLGIRHFNKKIKTFELKRKKILNPTWCTQKNRKNRYSADVPYYTVEPHEEFHDIIFLNLDRIQRNIIRTNSPKLVYEILEREAI